jgi:hypothetical protein
MVKWGNGNKRAAVVATALSALSALGAMPEPEVVTKTVTETVVLIEPISTMVLPVLNDCDSAAVGEWVTALVAEGWQTDVADTYGEALASPDGRVIVRLGC